MFFGYILCYVVNEHYYSKVTHREKTNKCNKIEEKNCSCLTLFWFLRHDYSYTLRRLKNYLSETHDEQPIKFGGGKDLLLLKIKNNFVCYSYGLITGTILDDPCRKLITSSELCLSESCDYMPWHHIHWKYYLPILINRTKNIKDICNFYALAFYWFIEPTLYYLLRHRLL